MGGGSAVESCLDNLYRQRVVGPGALFCSPGDLEELGVHALLVFARGPIHLTGAPP